MLIRIYLRELNASSGQPLMIVSKDYIVYLRGCLRGSSYELLLIALHELLNENGPL